MSEITMNKNQSYYIDHLGKNIFFTKKFLRAASILNSGEYKLLMELQTKHPGFKMVERKIDPPKKEKETYSGLTEKKVRDFLNWHFSGNETGLKKAEAELDELMMHCNKYHKNGKAGALKSWVVQNFKEAYIEWDKHTWKMDNSAQPVIEQNEANDQQPKDMERGVSYEEKCAV